MFRVKFVAFGYLFTSEDVRTLNEVELLGGKIAREVDVDRIWVEGDNGYHHG